MTKLEDGRRYLKMNRSIRETAIRDSVTEAYVRSARKWALYERARLARELDSNLTIEMGNLFSAVEGLERLVHA